MKTIGKAEENHEQTPGKLEHTIRKNQGNHMETRGTMGNPEQNQWKATGKPQKTKKGEAKKK